MADEPFPPPLGAEAYKPGLCERWNLREGMKVRASEWSEN